MLRFENIKWIILAVGVTLLAVIQYTTGRNDSRDQFQVSDNSTWTNRTSVDPPELPESKPIVVTEPMSNHRTVSEWSQPLDGASRDASPIKVDDIQAPVELSQSDFNFVDRINKNPTGLSKRTENSPRERADHSGADRIANKVLNSPTLAKVVNVEKDLDEISPGFDIQGSDVALQEPEAADNLFSPASEVAQHDVDKSKTAAESLPSISSPPTYSELKSNLASGQNLDSTAETGSDSMPEMVDATPSQSVVERAGAEKSRPSDQAPQHFTIEESAQIRAVHHIEYGKTLARRGALFTAQREFFGALRVIAQAINQQTGTKTHTNYLDQAIQTMSDANDFYVLQDEVNGFVDVARVCETHSLKLITPEMAKSMSPPQAMQIYYAYAQDRFLRAAGHTVVGAEAHFGLGKLHSIKGKRDGNGNSLDYAKAVVHHSTALGSDSNHFQSANELGVLLAQSGQLEHAKDVFVKSLRVRQLPETWGNLVTVHERLAESLVGEDRNKETRLAELARGELRRVLESPSNTNMAGNRIQWVTPQQFSNQANTEFEPKTANRSDAADPKKSDRSIKGMLKKLF